MKHKVKVKVPVEKKDLFGKRTIIEERIIEVDDKTYRKLKKEQRDRPYSIDEMMLYDELFDDVITTSSVGNGGNMPDDGLDWSPLVPVK